MIDNLSHVLPIFIYILLIGLIVICIIIGIKIIITLNKVEKIVDNVESKVHAFDGVFSIIETASNKLSSFYEKVIDFITSTVSKLFNKKKEREDDEYYE